MFACRVNTNRFDLVFLCGEGVDAFVLGGGVGVDDFVDPGGADGLEDVEGTGDVMVDGFERLFEALDEGGLGGEVEDAVSAFEEREDGGFANVGAMEFDARVDIVESAGGKIVDSDDREASIEQGQNRVAA